MSMIFPGMDPYLENPQLWPGVHNSLIVHIRDRLQPSLRPRYVAAIEERVYLEGAKLELHESYIHIVNQATDHRVVAVIEIVSPSNKFAGQGRELYIQKQKEVRDSSAHLVEIDLLRGGQHVLAVPEYVARGKGDYDYLISVNRSDVADRGVFELYLRQLREPLPNIRIPLADGDNDVTLDIQAVLTQTYDAACYRELLDYRRPCVPALAENDLAWADALIDDALGTST